MAEIWYTADGAMTKPAAEEIAATITQALPPGISQELKQAIHAALMASFDRLGLVTREELEIQEQVLARTRAKLKEMEARVAELENELLNK